MVLLAGTVLACGEAPRPIELRVGLDPAGENFGEVEVWGLPPALRKSLSRIPDSDSGWSGALTIKAAATEQDVPPLAGRYRIEPSGCLKFSPRFSPEGPLSYRVRLDPGALVKLAGAARTSDTVQQWMFRLPSRPIPAPTTDIAGIYPSAPVVPANQLRWYLEFTAPMREGEAARMVELLDQEGQVVEGAFLRREEELWNPDRTRLTLLFDMARVKHAIRRRLEVGPVLVAGRSYTLRVSPEWQDSRGARLVHGLTHRFKAGPGDFSAIEPHRWALQAPVIGSRKPVRIDFGKPLDHALASRFIAVRGPDDEVLTGTVKLVNHDREWQFVPDTPWLAGRYQLRINPALEDLAGNRVGHRFDADLTKGQDAGVAAEPSVIEFFPTGELSFGLTTPPHSPPPELHSGR